MEVIGAGLPRTATLTQKIALEMLGIGPCYHMVNMVSDLSGVQQWSDAADRKADGGQVAWSKIFAGFRAAVDWPGAFFYRDLMETYPDAKVLLSVRDSEAWARSMHQTIWGALAGDTMLHDLAVARSRIEPEWRQFLTLMQYMWERSGLMDASQDSFDTSALATAMERYNQQVRDCVPPERLLVWSPAQGWEPLCEFLGVPVPSAPLPRVNDSGSFVAMYTKDCMTALNRWHNQQYAAPAAPTPH
jgi:Sulfotransferase domain